MLLPLAELSKMEKAVVKHYLDDRIATRLIALGLKPQQALRVERFSPMGDAIYIRYGSSQMAVRRSEALQVMVEAI